MELFEIRGKNRLNGEVYINGAKNAAVAIIPAAIATNGICKIENVPDIEDVANLKAAITKLGAKCKKPDPHTLIIDSSQITSHIVDYKSVQKIRASYYMLGALLTRYKKAEVPLPGGCNFGERPIDQHIKGFEALGATVKIEHGMVKAYADALKGATIYLDKVSVGSTINIMLAAICAEGVTIIENAAKEPHIVDTANFLNMMGANVKGAGTDIIRVSGVPELHGCEYTIIPDQIEAGTYMIAAAVAGGSVTVTNIIPKHMETLSAKLREMGCEIEEGDDFLRVIRDGELTNVNVKTMSYPGFPTDLQPQMTALMAASKGTGVITETIWENRFQYVNELNRLGCKITVDGRVAHIEGGANLTGAEVNATDLRAGASLIIAALAAEGKTTIGNVRYINRGYETIEKKLGDLGADIKRICREDFE